MNQSTCVLAQEQMLEHLTGSLLSFSILCHVDRERKLFLRLFVCLFLSMPADDSVLKTSPAPNLGYMRAIKLKPRELTLLPFLKSRGL